MLPAVRALDKARNGGLSGMNGSSLLDKPKSESVSSLDCMSDSECGTSDVEGVNGDATNLSSGSVPKDECDSFGPPSKRLKGSASNSPSPARAQPLSTR